MNMIGKRFYDETAGQYTANSAGQIESYTACSYLNAKNIKYDPSNFINAALAGIGDGEERGRPHLGDLRRRRRDPGEMDTPSPRTWTWTRASSSPPTRIRELAARIVMKYQRVPMPPANLEETVARYNSFVDAGKDADFGKPAPKYKIAKPPFYAAWATPVVHDSRAGLRINAKCQVQDMSGEVIPGLYCGGESAGGFSEHGLARAICQGYIAGRHASEQTSSF